MSKVLGLAHLVLHHPTVLANAAEGWIGRDSSEQTAREVDEEVKQGLDDAYQQAKKTLTDHRDQRLTDGDDGSKDGLL